MYQYIIEHNGKKIGTWDTRTEAEDFIERLVISDKYKEKMTVKQVVSVRCPNCKKFTPEVFFDGELCIGCSELKADCIPSMERDYL